MGIHETLRLKSSKFYMSSSSIEKSSFPVSSELSIDKPVIVCSPAASIKVDVFADESKSFSLCVVSTGNKIVSSVGYS